MSRSWYDACMSCDRKNRAPSWVLMLLIALLPFSVHAATFTSGTVNTYNNTTNTAYDAGAKLDSTHAIVAYSDAGVGNAAIATTDGTTLTFGSEYQFCASSCDAIAVAMLDSTHAVIVYDVSGTGYAVVATISDTVISYGTATTFASSIRTGSPSIMAVAAMDTTHIAITYVTQAAGPVFTTRVIAATVSGTTLTFGSATALQATSGQYVAIAAMDSTHFISFYQQNNGTPYIIAASVSGTSMSFGSPVTFSGYNSDPSVSMLDSTHAVVAYRSTSGNNVYAFVATLSDTSLSAGTSQAVNSVSSYYPFAATLDSTHLVLMFRNNDADGFPIHVSQLTVSAGAVTGDASTFAISTDLGNNNRRAIALDSTSAIILANDKAVVVTTDTTAPSAPSSFTATPSESSMALSWVNPVDADFLSTTIRRSSTAFPTGIGSGSSVASGLTGTSTTDSGLSNGTYYYGIFARDLRGNYSAVATASGAVNAQSVGGGGVSTFLLQLRQRNGLDPSGRPLAGSSSSQTSSSSSSSSSSLSSSASSNVPEIAHPAANVASFASSASSSSVAAESPLQIRTCARAMKWFRGNGSVLGRLNARLMKHFGFECRA